MKKNSLKSLLFLTSLLLVSCTSQKKEVTDYNQLADKFLRAYNTHDAAAIVQLYREDCIVMQSGEAQPIRGRKGIEQSLLAYFKAFPDMKIEFVTVVGKGDQVCFEFLEKGTFTGPLASAQGEVAPTGKPFEIKGAFLAKVAPDGLIAEDRTYFDTTDLNRQIGLQ